MGHGVDLLAVFGTTFGVATSLGLGVNQMATGLNVLFGVDPGVMTRILLIVGISIVATLSAVSGVGNGIRIISEWNIWLSVVLLAFFLFGGPFKWLMGFFVTSLGDYIWNLIPMGFWTAGTEKEVTWQGSWPIFYWGWWICSPKSRSRLRRRWFSCSASCRWCWHSRSDVVVERSLSWRLPIVTKARSNS